MKYSRRNRDCFALVFKVKFGVIEQINIRCTFINTVSCDEQYGLYKNCFNVRE